MLSIDTRLPLAAVLAFTVSAPLHAADFTCGGLVPIGQKMICSGFEPNWAVELVCAGQDMTSTFIDAFSGNTIVTTPGTVAIASWDPWVFTTSHGIKGSVAMTPAGCTDESDAVRRLHLHPDGRARPCGPVPPLLLPHPVGGATPGRRR